MSDVTREEIDAKLAATEARIDATLQHAVAKIDHLPSTWTLIGAVGGGFVAVAALTIAVLSYGGDRFDGGASVGASLETTHQLTKQNAEQIKKISDQISEQQQMLNLLIQNANRQQKPKR
ncbi:MAG: hypothetical protein KGR48_00495 [Alphaproteobacteria bacterium]|nr:hypothetical protein [Alphaproteobacteria bacterium]MDE2012252.1 hypothetical protein [Alphaproteobacteria bacterium]MDE2352709.1 hypothetical protein [Alphaproteobacteria bacterium]